MAWNERDAAILLADITGSTPLYQDAGNVSALRQITDCLEGLRRVATQGGGSFALSKGDDLLCAFAEPAAAVHAARAMLTQFEDGALDIHVGLHFGQIIQTGDDIFGDAVNVTARLTDLARPGEVLISRDIVERVWGDDPTSLVRMGDITLKGKDAPTAIYSLSRGDTAVRTEIARRHGTGHTVHRPASAGPGLIIRLTFGGQSYVCQEGKTLTIGRAQDCAITLSQRWVSRRHATVRVRHSKTELCDESLSGTYVTMRGATPDGHPILVRRETTLLVGSGTISPAVRPHEANAHLIEYEVINA